MYHTHQFTFPLDCSCCLRRICPSCQFGIWAGPVFSACLGRTAISVRSASAYVVHLLHGAIEGHIPEFLVHVVVACPRLATHPNAKVLDSRRLLLKNLQCKRVQSVIFAPSHDTQQPTWAVLRSIVVQAHTSFTAKICPFAFFTFRSFLRKYLRNQRFFVIRQQNCVT